MITFITLMDLHIEKKVLRRIAAIDIGTNSFHAVIVDIYSDGSFSTVDKLKEMVLLAESGIGDRLTEEAMNRGIDVLRKIKTLCDHKNVERVLAYATSAIREAENGGDFIQRAIDEVGIKINAISGKLEAKLIAYAVRHGISIGRKPVMMVDIGGGSVEFILGNRDTFYFLASKKIGVARMAADIINSDPVSERNIKALRDHYRQQLEDVAQAFALHRTQTIIGSSGTLQNIALIISGQAGSSPNLSLNELIFTKKQFFALYEKVIPMSREERRKLKGLDEKRVDIIVPGLVLMDYLIRTFGIRQVRISEQALREGIVLRYIKNELSEIREILDQFEPRERSIYELLRKCDWHEDHSKHVASIALKLFDTFSEELDLPAGDRELLRYSAYMHDIGYFISHRKHHKHALYLIRNADLKGFTEEEVEVMANVARYHRRSIPKPRHKEYDKLPSDVKERVRKLSGILRIADGLDRSHYQNVRSIQCEKNVNTITLWLTTEEDPQLEIWGAKRKSELFSDITNRRIEIKSEEILGNVKS